MTCVYDNLTGTYSQPVCVNSVGEAKRSFMNAAITPGNLINQYAKDYTLVRIGNFDDDTAYISLLDTVESLLTGLEAKHLAEEYGLTADNYKEFRTDES